MQLFMSIEVVLLLCVSHSLILSTSLPLSGSHCLTAATATAAAACAARRSPCCPGDPPNELGVSCTGCWPHGQEAGGAGLNGTDAGNVQLHAGVDLAVCVDLFVLLYCGTNDFCSQDSVLDFDGQPIDPAIVSAQPMKPAQNMEVPQMGCPPGMLYKYKGRPYFICWIKFWPVLFLKA